MHQHMPEAVSYDGALLTIIDHNGRPWLTAADLARALGYADTRSVTRIFSRHTDEFTDDMAGVVKLTTPGNPMPIPVRIFSPRGCHLVAMFAHTPRAAGFRRWVLDVLEGLEASAQAGPSLPLPPDEAALLAAQLDSIRVRFCGGRAPSEECDELRGRIDRIREALRTSRLALERAERDLKEAEAVPQAPGGLALAAATERERRAQRRLGADHQPAPLSPERQAELERLRQELDDPPRT
jgi:hypothetical protein